MNKPSTRAVATVTAALVLLTAMTITEAGPAAAHARGETERSHPAPGALLADAATTAEVQGWRRLFASVATGFDAVGAPVTTLGESLVGKGRLRAGARDLLPSEVVDFYDGLTDEDKTVLQEIAAKHVTFENEDQALDALKEKSPKLYDKAAELRQLLKGKLDALNPEAKTFVNGVIERLKAVRPNGGERPNLMEISRMADEVLEQYRALPDDARESLKVNFPRLDAIIQEIRDRLA
jgi:hypothetical protein